MILATTSRRESRNRPGVKYFKMIVVAICLLHLPAGWAVPPQTEGEIRQLLNHISSSDCEFERNGSIYTQSEARAHIERKYKHTRRHIETSEEFIKYTATESSITGRPYRVRCGNVEEDTGIWLNQALKTLRGSR